MSERAGPPVRPPEARPADPTEPPRVASVWGCWLLASSVPLSHPPGAGAEHDPVGQAPGPRHHAPATRQQQQQPLPRQDHHQQQQAAPAPCCYPAALLVLVLAGPGGREGGRRGRRGRGRQNGRQIAAAPAAGGGTAGASRPQQNKALLARLFALALSFCLSIMLSLVLMQAATAPFSRPGHTAPRSPPVPSLSLPCWDPHPLIHNANGMHTQLQPDPPFGVSLPQRHAAAPRRPRPLSCLLPHALAPSTPLPDCRLCSRGG